MDCATFVKLFESVRQVIPPNRWVHPWWRFNTPRMDYTASPDWYAGAV